MKDFRCRSCAGLLPASPCPKMDTTFLRWSTNHWFGRRDIGRVTAIHGWSKQIPTCATNYISTTNARNWKGNHFTFFNYFSSSSGGSYFLLNRSTRPLTRHSFLHTQRNGILLLSKLACLVSDAQIHLRLAYRCSRISALLLYVLFSVASVPFSFVHYSTWPEQKPLPFLKISPLITSQTWMLPNIELDARACLAEE